MKALIKKCPSCHHDLTVAVLHCPECGLELKNDFEMSPFDKLNDEQADFLTAFLRNHGNLKNLQAELQISYPYAKKKLDNVLAALGIAAEEAEANESQPVDLSNVSADRSSTKASEIIKAKLIEAGGRAKVRLYGGELRDIIAAPNGRDFLCPQLIPLSYGIFD